MTFAHSAAGVGPAEIREQIVFTLERFLESKARAAAQCGLPPEVVRTLSGFVLSGAKRLRPLLCVLGWQAAVPDSIPPHAVVQTAAAIELCHNAILIHDDVVDNSDTRRGQPTVHRALAEYHRARGDTRAFGVHGAVILGDLMMVWADELIRHALTGHPKAASVLQLFDAIRCDVDYGQYLDLLTTASLSADLDSALATIHYKTTSYTFEGPLHLGATLADAQPETFHALSAYARPLGIAIQLQNDLIDTYGDRSSTVEPCLSDLREGKHTPLLAIALAHATPDQAAVLRQLVGRPDLTVADAEVCQAIFDLRARHEVESMIQARWADADHALDNPALPDTVRATLEQIAASVGLGTIYGHALIESEPRRTVPN